MTTIFAIFFNIVGPRVPQNDENRSRVLCLITFHASRSTLPLATFHFSAASWPVYFSRIFSNCFISVTESFRLTMVELIVFPIDEMFLKRSYEKLLFINSKGRTVWMEQRKI